jgi:DNA-binding HxlR family transcriptional regulator
MENRWSFLIVHNLLTGVKRFGELKMILDISPKVLTQRLRTLEEKGFVHREVYAEVPPRVEYSLTELGHSLKSIHDAMWSWGEENKEVAEYVWEIGANFLIVHHLLPGTKRFGDLKKAVEMSPRALTHHLHLMEEKGFVHREVYAEVPPRVEYSLTELGYSLKPIHDMMWSWGEEHNHYCQKSYQQ